MEPDADWPPVRWYHHEGGDVVSVAFSPDGGSLAVGSDYGTVRIYELATGVESTRLVGPRRSRDLSFSPDGRRLAAGEYVVDLVEARTLDRCRSRENGPWLQFAPDGTPVALVVEDEHQACVVEVLTGNTRSSFPVNRWVHDADISPDTRRLALVDGYPADGLQIRDAETGELIATVPLSASLGSVAFAPDGLSLAMQCDGEPVRIVDTTTGALRDGSPLDYAFHALYLCFAPDGRRLAARVAYREVHVVDVPSGRMVASIPHERTVNCLAFSPDGRSLATGDDLHRARVFDAATGELCREFDLDTVIVGTVGFSPNGTLLATGAEDGLARVHDATTGALILTVSHHYPVEHVEFAADGATLTTWGRERDGRGVERVISLTDGATLTEQRGRPWAQREERSEDGAWVLHRQSGRVEVRDRDGVCRWTIESTAPVLDEELDEEFVGDGDLIALVVRDPLGDDRSIRVHRCDTGELLWTAPCSDRNCAFEFSPDGAWVVVFEPDAVVVRDGVTGEFRARIGGLSPDAAGSAFAPGSDLVIVFTDEGAQHLVDPASGEVTASGVHPGSGWPVFTVDGALMATAYDDGCVVVSRVIDGSVVAHALHGARVTAMAFDGTGARLATACEDGHARIVEVSTGREVLRLPHGENAMGELGTAGRLPVQPPVRPVEPHGRHVDHPYKREIFRLCEVEGRRCSRCSEPSTQAELLMWLLLHPDREYGVSELAEPLDVPLSTLHREVVRLGEADLIASRTVGRNRLVRANPAHRPPPHRPGCRRSPSAPSPSSRRSSRFPARIRWSSSVPGRHGMRAQSGRRHATSTWSWSARSTGPTSTRPRTARKPDWAWR